MDYLDKGACMFLSILYFKWFWCMWEYEWIEDWNQRSLTPTQIQDQIDTTIEDNDQLFASNDYDRVSELVQKVI